jgi:hypothetical protein
MKNAVLVIDQNRFDRVIDPVAITDVESRFAYVRGQVEDDILLEALDR